MTLKTNSAAPLGRFLGVVAGLIVLAGCGGSSTPVTTTPPPVSGNNVSSLEINLGPANEYINGLFTSVQVCAPSSTTNCVTIPDVLVDTGSYGFRVLSSALGSLSLPSVTDLSGNDVQECVQYVSLAYTWGPVEQADLHLAGETASSASIQVISESPTYPVPSSCLTLGTNGAVDYNTVSTLLANGILGVGALPQDCGSDCAEPSPTTPMYYSCPNGNCQITSVPTSATKGQLWNPVALFSQDNNGVLVSLPNVPAGGQATASGSLIFGIGTQSNNAIGSAQIYATTPDQYFTTTYNGVSYANSFIDSGSNGLYFLDSTTLGNIECSDYTSFYCPGSTLNFNVTNTGINGTTGPVGFSIANADSLFQNDFAAYNDLGGDSGTTPSTLYFDFGIPFFYNRNVFVGIAGTTVPNGASAPNGYWAY